MPQETLNRIDAALAHFRITDQRASKDAGLNKDFIRNIRRGKSRSPRSEDFGKLASFFECSEKWLRGDPKADAPEWAMSEHMEDLPTKSASGDIAPRYRIDELDVRASAGNGALLEHERKVAEWELPRELMRIATTAQPDKIKIITIIGDSMEPMFRPLDRVMVDISDTTPSPPGIFIVWDGMGLVAKRVQYLANSDPPAVRISSENTKYESYDRAIGEAHIQGRVLGKWQWT